jgi:hypothetical protein
MRHGENKGQSGLDEDTIDFESHTTRTNSEQKEARRLKCVQKADKARLGEERRLNGSKRSNVPYLIN